MKSIPLIGALVSLLFGTPGKSAETITYTYDAKGRLTKVVRTGTVNNSVTTQYTHDKSDNRKTKVTTNSPNTPPP
jgi:hypothetical protein